MCQSEDNIKNVKLKTTKDIERFLIPANLSGRNDDPREKEEDKKEHTSRFLLSNASPYHLT